MVGIVATKGAEDVLCRNCVSKAARFVRLCDAFSIPVVTLVNTDGFVKSASDDMAGGLREAARLAGTYADATTAKVAVITGKAVGVAYTALANADLTLSLIHISEPTRLGMISYAVFCLKKKNTLNSMLH